MNNQCRRNEVTGILFKQEAQGKAENNVCEQNKARWNTGERLRDVARAGEQPMPRE